MIDCIDVFSSRLLVDSEEAYLLICRLFQQIIFDEVSLLKINARSELNPKEV